MIDLLKQKLPVLFFGTAGLRSPKDLPGLEHWLDTQDTQSMIYDASNRVSLLADKSGRSGSGRWGPGQQALHLTGASGQYASVPDSAALSIAGDIDLRVQATLMDWASSSPQVLISKDNSSAGTRGWVLYVHNGNVFFGWSSDGTAQLSLNSSSSLGLPSQATKWIRVAFDVDNGASGRTATFYTSDDGQSWTILGTAQTSAGVTSHYDNATAVQIGANINGTNAIPKGRIHRAQVYNGINGTLVLDADFTVQRPGAVTFTENSSNAATVTINGTAMIGWFDSANCLCLNGVAGNFASAPDAAALDITGDIDVRVDCAAVDWTPGGSQYCLSKWQTTGVGSNAYILGINSSGVLEFAWSTNGTTNTTSKTSTVPTGLANYARAWIRATLDVDDGAGNNVVTFYTSTDNGVTWNQLGAAVTTAGTTSIANATAQVQVGTFNAGGAGGTWNGRIYRAQIYNGIAGTLALDANFGNAPKLAPSFIESSSNAATVTINSSGDLGARICGERDLYQGTVSKQPVYLQWGGTNYGWLNGVAGGYFSTPDSAGVSVTGDIDLRWTGTLSDWTPASECSLIAKSAAAGSQYSYVLVVRTTGALRLYVSLNGNTYAVQATSTASVSFTDGSRGAVRATRNSTTGDCVFYTSTDGSSWVQLGDTVAAAPGAIFDGTAVVEVGSLFTGTVGNAQAVRHERAQVLNGIGGTVVADFNPALYTSGTTFTASTGEVWTLNGGSTIVTRSCLYFDGSDDYMKAAAFSLSQPETVYFVGSQVTWTNNDRAYDGNAADSMTLNQTNASAGASPQVGIYAASQTGLLSTWALGTNAVMSAVFNGASSLLRRNRDTASTGNAGASNGAGFTLGANGNGTGTNGNITFSEAAIYAAAHDTATQDNVIVGIAGKKWKFPV